MTASSAHIGAAIRNFVQTRATGQPSAVTEIALKLANVYDKLHELDDEAGYLSSRLDLYLGIFAPTVTSTVTTRPEIVASSLGEVDLTRVAAALTKLDAPTPDRFQVVAAKRMLDEWLDEHLTRIRGTQFFNLTSVEQDTFAHELSGLHSNLKHIRALDRASEAEELTAALIEAREAVADTLAARDSAQSAAGQTGEAVLGMDFTTDSRRDAQVAALLSLGSVVSLGGALGVGLWVISGIHEISIPLVIGKLALTIPLLGLSAYFGRLSSHYRDAARWARSAAVQLKSIDAYTRGFTSERAQEEVRLVLGRRIFGDPGLGRSPKSADTEDAIAIIDAVGRLRSADRSEPS